MTEETRQEPTPENSGDSVAPEETPAPVESPPPAPSSGAAPGTGPDRGRTVALAAMGGLVLLGVVLMARGPRAPEAAPAAAMLTNAPAERGATDAGVSEAVDASVSAPVVVRDPDAGAVRPPPAFRVSSLKAETGVEIVEGTYGKKSFAAALAGVGIAKAEIKRITHAFEGVHHFDHPPTTAAFVVARDKAKGTVLGFEHVASPTEVWQARVDEATSDKRLVGKRLELFVEHKKVATAMVVSADLAKAVAGAGLHEGALEAIDDALEGHVDLSTIRSGARLRVLAEEEWVEGAFARFKVDAVELAPKTGATQRVYFYERAASSDSPRRNAPHPGFYDAKGQQPYRGAFRSPLPFARVTSRFNPKRMHPVLHVVMPHNGIDYGASTGTPVYASAAGTVTTAGDGGPCGNMIRIEHAGGLTTAYCHLSRFAPGVHAGLHVEARQLVGYVGQSGRATGPHLHFAVLRGGTFIDPMGLKMDGVRVLPPSDREVFGKKRTELDASLDGIALPAADGTPDAKDDDKEEPATGEE